MESFTLRQWPDREEWARQRRMIFRLEVSTSFADIATAEEIEALHASLRDRWREYGRALRAASDTNEAQEIRDKRRGINRAMKHIGQGEVPYHLGDHYGAQDLLAPFIGRWTEAQRRAEDAKALGVPVDDAAWEAELRRRARIEDKRRRREDLIKAARLLDDGRPLRKISAALAAHGFTTRYGNPYSASAVKAILVGEPLKSRRAKSTSRGKRILVPIASVSE